VTLRKIPVNKEFEDEIVTLMIANTHYLREMYNWYDPLFFSDYGKVVSKWVIEYWNAHRKAPGKTIKVIFSVEKEKLKPDLADNVATYLSGLSDDYEKVKEINVQYMADRTFAYFRKKELELRIEQISELLNTGKDDEAENTANGKSKLTRKLTRAKTLSRKEIVDVYEARDAGVPTALKLSGVFGQLIGELNRGWLVSIMAPAKRGKSFLLQEMAMQGARQGKNVVYINVEMGEFDLFDRFTNQIASLPADTVGKIGVPAFDCVWNQHGKCPIPHLRKNKIELCTKQTGYEVPKWEEADPRYRTCTVCRDDPKYKKNYVLAIWHIPYKGGTSRTLPALLKSASSFRRQYGDRLRLLTYPTYSVSFSDVEKDVNRLIADSRFIPDIIILDYGDILKPERHYANERDRLSEDWKRMKGFAETNHVLWLTATQTNREGAGRTTITQKDIAEDWRKFTIVDLMIGIHQTPADKEKNLFRTSVLARRSGNFSGAQVVVLNQLDLGLPYIDSEWVPIKHNEKEETNDNE
jgi:hypothetical protein